MGAFIEIIKEEFFQKSHITKKRYVLNLYLMGAISSFLASLLKIGPIGAFFLCITGPFLTPIQLFPALFAPAEFYKTTPHIVCILFYIAALIFFSFLWSYKTGSCRYLTYMAFIIMCCLSPVIFMSARNSIDALWSGR